MRPGVALEEILPRREPAPADPAPLAERLQLCSRLLGVAAEELEALERGDHLKRYALAERREELLHELHPPAAGEDPAGEESRGPGPDELLLLLPQEVARLLAEALYELEEREEEERRMQDRWSSLEEDALRAMHVGGKIVSLRTGRYPNQPRSDASLDLRF